MNNVDGGTPAAWYLASVATFMIPAGIQMVLLPYLLAIELNQPAERFGITQMIGQLPILVFLLVGGWLADRVDPRRLLMVIQSAAIGMPLLLAFSLWRGQISEGLLVLYALAWGLVTAFAMPARDGLLKRVAGSNVQRMVTLAMGMQFGAMMIGQGMGGRAAHWGSISILLVQCLVLASGIIATSRLPSSAVPPIPGNAGSMRDSLWREFGSGVSLIFSDSPMRATLLLTLGMGVFFIGGAYVVLIPLAIRDLYAGGAAAVAVLCVRFRLGHVRRRGHGDVAHDPAGTRASDASGTGDGGAGPGHAGRRPARFADHGLGRGRSRCTPGGVVAGFGCGDHHQRRPGHAFHLGPAFAKPVDRSGARRSAAPLCGAQQGRLWKTRLQVGCDGGVVDQHAAIFQLQGRHGA